MKFGAISSKIDILSMTALKFESKNPLVHYDTYNCDYLPHTIFRFCLINFHSDTDFLSQFCVFTVKSPTVTQRSVSLKNAFKKSKNPSAFLFFLFFFFFFFFCNSIGSNNYFTLFENNFRFLR